VALKFAHAEDIDQATLVQVRQRVTDGVRGFVEMRSNLLVGERPVLLQQREDRPLHR
jgi:hypothetical protein